MIIDRKIVTEENFDVNKDGDDTYIEIIFESSNILKTLYFPKEQKLFISFMRGDTYSYANITEELYKEFEEADSQGKFFAKKIRTKKEKHPYRKEFTLFPREIDRIKAVINEHKKNENKES